MYSCQCDHSKALSSTFSHCRKQLIHRISKPYCQQQWRTNNFHWQ